MQVTTVPGSGHDRRVSVSAPGVEGSGTWFGALPAAGETVDVEFEVRGEIAWDDIVVDPAPDGPVAVDGHLTLQGEVIGLGIDNVLMLYTLGGGIVLVETTGEAPAGTLGRIVLLTARDVTIRPAASPSAPLIVTIDGTRVAGEDDIHAAFRAVLDLGPNRAGDVRSLQDRLAKDVPRPLHVTWTDASRSEAALGADAYTRYTAMLADVRARDVEGGHPDPFTYEIRR